jgi:hypothetical protein
MRRTPFCVALILIVSGSTALECAVAAPAEGPGGKAAVREKFLQKFDANGNGQLDPDEREAAKEAMQKRREQGGKGQGGVGKDPERRRKILEKFDKDGDGKLSESERAAAKEARGKRGA